MEKKMKQDMDKIQFEERSEIRELMKMVEIYTEQNPEEKENETISRFYELLDVIEMCW